ncbi:ribonuclease H-like domain-containing protein, partial [Tanacetum coccineum]
NGPNWLFDLDALTISMNYKPVVTGNQTNGNAGTKENIDASQARKKIVPDQEYILLPLLTSDPSLSKSSKDSPDARFKPSGQEEKIDFENQENEDKNNAVDENIVYGCIDDPNMPNLEEIVYSDDDEEVGAEADMNNLATTMPVSPILTTRVHKDHPLEQIIGDIQSAPQIRRMTKNVTEHVEPKKVIQALIDPSWIEAIRLFLAYASFMGFIVYQMDVKSAFLYGTIEEEVYVCQPPCFEDPQFFDKVYKGARLDRTLSSSAGMGELAIVRVLVAILTIESSDECVLLTPRILTLLRNLGLAVRGVTHNGLIMMLSLYEGGVSDTYTYYGEDMGGEMGKLGYEHSLIVGDSEVLMDLIDSAFNVGGVVGAVVYNLSGVSSVNCRDVYTRKAPVGMVFLKRTMLYMGWGFIGVREGKYLELTGDGNTQVGLVHWRGQDYINDYVRERMGPVLMCSEGETTQTSENECRSQALRF